MCLISKNHLTSLYVRICMRRLVSVCLLTQLATHITPNLKYKMVLKEYLTINITCLFQTENKHNSCLQH